MRTIRTLLRLFFGLALLGGLASALGAAYARGRIESRGDESDDEFDVVAIYAGQDFTSRAGALRRASVLSWYGGGTVDLRGASLDPAGATLTARSIFGGIRLVVPETWRVEHHVTGLFGGIGDARPAGRVDDALPVLRLEGFLLFGGVGIVAEAPDLDEQTAPAPAADAHAPEAAAPAPA